MSTDLTKEYFIANECVERLEFDYRDKLVVNDDLDRSIVSFQANKSEPIFRWFHYREGFSRKLIEYIIDQLDIPEEGVLVDPFAGTGAALYVGNEYSNMRGIAFELLPVGIFFMESRNFFGSLSNEKVIQYAKKTLKSRSKWTAFKPTWKFRHLRITRGAFSKDTEYELCQYKTWASLQDKEYSIFLDFVSFSILEEISFTRKDGQYLRWDRRSPRYEKSNKKTKFEKAEILKFYAAIKKKLNQIITDLSLLGNLFEEPYDIKTGKIQIIQGSVLEEIERLEDNSVDCVITSPPYCNRYDYTRTYALELAYLGIDEEEIKRLRQTLLTCTVENKPKQFDWLDEETHKKAEEAFSNSCLKKIINFLDKEIELNRLNNRGIRTMVQGYFYDSAIHLSQIVKKMKSGAYYVMVNDNVRYNGLRIPVDLLLSEIAKSVGLITERIWVLPNGKGNSSQQMKRHGRVELRKCVYVWRKS